MSKYVHFSAWIKGLKMGLWYFCKLPCLAAYNIMKLYVSLCNLLMGCDGLKLLAACVVAMEVYV